MDLTTFDAVLLDLDGTVWHDDVALPGSAELVRQMQARGQKFGFVSNSSASPARVVERLATMGMQVDPHTILTAAAAGCDYVLATFGEGARVFNAATPSVEELLAGRVTFVDDDAGACDVVLTAGLAHERAQPARQQIAMRHLMRGAKLVGLCNDRAYPCRRGFEIGAGAVTAMLAYAANVIPTFCGKPEAWFFLDLCRHLGVDPARCVLIGDNLEADIAGARRVGMKTILTLTGLATRITADTATADQRPDFVVRDLSDLAR